MTNFKTIGDWGQKLRAFERTIILGGAIETFLYK